MASISLGNRFDNKFSRIQVDNVILSGKISNLREKVSKAINAPPGEIELIYCGRCLQDEETVESYGITAGVTIHVMKKVGTNISPPVAEPLDGAAIQQLTTALQDAFLNAPTSRNVSVINRMLTAPETLENIVAATPGLENDPVALAILQTPQFVAYLADPSTVQKILEAHPCVGQAAMMVAAALNEEAAKGGLTTTSSEDNPGHPGTYSLDQMSDDEDFDGPPPQRPPNSGQAITTSQLAAALAAATRGPQPSDSQPAASNSGPPVITGDFFRQAMMQAMESPAAGSSAAPASNNTTTTQQQQQVLQSQLQQLREMGITDDAAALQALQASGGDLQMALSILFGDNM